MSTPIGALLPPAVQPASQPYVTPAQFVAYPTWLDLTNLVPGGLASLQTDDLGDVLLAASLWADSQCEGMRLSAHLVTGENVTTRLSGGRISLQPRDIPVSSVVSLAYGWDPAAQTTLSLGPGVLWNEGGRLISFRPGGTTPVFVGPPIQFGNQPVGSGKVFVTWSYVAGYVSTTLSAPCSAGANSAQLTDPTGVMPGQTLRIYDAGQDQAGATEALTVASTYVPQVPTSPPTPTTIPLAANTTYAHAAGTGITGFPRDALQAVTAYAVGLLMREDVAEQEPASDFGPAARRAGDGGRGASGGLIEQAERWLDKYRPVWR